MKIATISRALLIFVTLVQLVTVGSTSFAAPDAQVQSSEDLAREMLARMTPEEKVGQLFIVDFDGSALEEDGQLSSLIADYHIGGVNFKAVNGNIPQGDDSLLQTWLLIQEIQRAEISNSLQSGSNRNTGEPFSPAQIPLFIAIQQGGDGYPADQILAGVSPLPSQIAIGATWDTDLARQTGTRLGSELSLLGFNLLLGPSLNVHSDPRPELTGDLGVNSFSGSPFWTGELGKAFIAGLHEGSDDKLAVVGKNFPGFVGGNLPLNEEIPTVRKTLDQLLRNELPPFFAVTNLGAEAGAVTDGLLLTHSRYQAFQSNITTVTPPLTLDPQALDQLLSLQEFNTWHANGGLIISDELGTQAIRRYYIQIGQGYDPRLISRDALLAGNDILLTGNFKTASATDLFTSIVNTLDFFAQKYRDDVAFAQVVDGAVLRILIQKYQLYNNSFEEDNVIIPSNQLDSIQASGELTFEIARQAATLINPAPENLNNVLPNPPAEGDFITIITDTAEVRPCPDCEVELEPPVRALELVIERLYGPAGDGLIFPGNVVSYSYAELITALSQATPPDSQIQTHLGGADWLVFLQRDVDPNRPDSLALSRLISEAPELIQEKKIVVFGLDAPYYLSATEISAVSAYY
ncbi:MAG: glycoside hydrolase family 3 N-terminal domain-containing protein, partial [Anaerolineales bacterium]